MSLVYRTSGDWGPGKGANLTATEFDENMWEIQQRLQDLEAIFGSSGAPYNISGPAFTPNAVHLGRYLRVTGFCVITMPSEADYDAPVGPVTAFRQVGVDTFMFEDSTDVVVTGKTGFLRESAGQGSVCFIKKVADGEWELWGDLNEEITATAT